jgi:PPOX class probable F420-dependent enzyme
MAELTAEVRELFEARNFAHLATVLPDGSPHTVPVWMRVEDGRLVFFTQTQSRKARNLEHDPRVAISIVDERNPYRSAWVRGRVVDRIEGERALEVHRPDLTAVHRRGLPDAKRRRARRRGGANRPRRAPVLALTGGLASRARPGPIFRPVTEARSNGVLVHVSDDGFVLPVALDDVRAEPPLKEMADAVVELVEPLRVREVELVHST